MVDVAPQRRDVTELAVHRLEAGDAARGKGADRPGGDGVDADAVRAEVGREVAHARLERGLGDAHHVVVGNDLLGAVVGQRHHAAARRHQRRGRASQRDQRIGADIQGEREAVARRVDEAAVELLALGEGEGVDKDVEAALLASASARRRARCPRRSARRTAPRTSSRCCPRAA